MKFEHWRAPLGMRPRGAVKHKGEHMRDQNSSKQPLNKFYPASKITPKQVFLARFPYKFDPLTSSCYPKHGILNHLFS